MHQAEFCAEFIAIVINFCNVIEQFKQFISKIIKLFVNIIKRDCFNQTILHYNKTKNSYAIFSFSNP